jgi:Fur family ferric uptake transcriptional regulator
MKYRTTPQKSKILEYIKKIKTHPTAEDAYNALREELPGLSLATVYRNLNFLADSGQILRLEIGNEYHFDGDKCLHQHCICKKCGKIIDVFHPEISEYVMKKISSEQFIPECVTIVFNGQCKSCM